MEEMSMTMKALQRASPLKASPCTSSGLELSEWVQDRSISS